MNNLNLVPNSLSNDSELVIDSIFDNKITLAILLELGQQKRKTFRDLIESLNVDEKEIIYMLHFLEKNGFIEQNPSKDNLKPFEKRIYKLKTKGAIFLQRIKEKFPELQFNFFF